MKDGMIDNWDLFEKMLDHTYSHYLQSEARYHPVLFSEAPVRNLYIYLCQDGLDIG